MIRDPELLVKALVRVLMRWLLGSAGDKSG
jgi:hypothetical protein